jgi:integrase
MATGSAVKASPPTYARTTEQPTTCLKRRRFPKVTTTNQNTKQAGLSCWGVFEAWVNERRPAPSTVNRWRSVFLRLDEVFKGRDITSLTHDGAIEWKGSLVTAQRSPTVANDIWLAAARTVFSWALSNKFVATNPFEGVTIAVPAEAGELQQREFNETEWRRVLDASLAPPPLRMARHNAMARRWVPWLCAYTGSRPGEITQLRGQDVQNHHGLWVIRITPEAGAVKGRRARTVPLHEHLLEQGFIQFAQAQGSGPLFYDPRERGGGPPDPLKPVRPPWVKARQKLAEWVRSLGVNDPNISPVHAWRHTFKRRASRAGIERNVRDAICGHKLRDVGDKYEAPTVEDMAVSLRRFPRYTLALLANGVNPTEVATKLGIGRSSVYRAMRERKIKRQPVIYRPA